MYPSVLKHQLTVFTSSSSSSNNDKGALLVLLWLVGSGLDWLLEMVGNTCGSKNKYKMSFERSTAVVTLFPVNSRALPVCLRHQRRGLLSAVSEPAWPRPSQHLEQAHSEMHNRKIRFSYVNSFLHSNFVFSKPAVWSKQNQIWPYLRLHTLWANIKTLTTTWSLYLMASMSNE